MNQDEANIKYNLEVTEFEDIKKNKYENRNRNTNDIYWKHYILNGLSSIKSSNDKDWKVKLYKFVSNNFLGFNYAFLNSMFIHQFNLLNFPDIKKYYSFRRREPILFLTSMEELISYSEKKNKKNKRKNNSEYFLKDLNINSSVDEENLRDIFDDNEKSSILSITSQKSEQSCQNIIEDNNREIKINCINIIRQHLENNHHPINEIITRFSEYYTIKLDKYLDKYYFSDEYKRNKVKEEIIEDIQNFIKIITVALKLFYSKVIDYEIFSKDKDIFLNLVCYILFNKKNFYNSLFNFFRLSNDKKTNDLLNKIKNLGNLTPEEAGVKEEFCLNEKIKENNINLKKDKFKKENMRPINCFLNDRDFIRRSFTPLIKKSNSFEEEDQDERNSFKGILNHQDFSKHFNASNSSLFEKFQKNLDDNPSKIPIPSLNNSENHLKIPYGEVINYIEKIRNYHTPLDKITIIALASILITDCIKEFWKGKEEDIDLDINADEIMTIYLYIVYNMNLSSIYTELDFIKSFIGEQTKKTMIGYYYNTIEGCLNFISSINSKEEFKNN